ncbi:Translocator protein [Ananas comosus]|uniref:Translocator protein n=1 Tax=Ananas comosus TaxID=4615 RepID=A0A199VZL4_ANACO|nr:Translocator protein [Ananas comosus]
MASSEGLKHRPRDDTDPTITTTATTMNTGVTKSNDKKVQKMAMARRGLRSLAVAVAVPLALALASACLSGGGGSGESSARPFWGLPRWVFGAAAVSTAGLAGLSAWLVWAEGGFHHRPADLGLFAAQLALGLLWGPLVFRIGATRLGLVVSLGLIGCLLWCSKCFHRVNPIAGDLLKPCLAWAVFLAVFNLKLV